MGGLLHTCDGIGQLKVGTSSTSSENRGYAYDAAWNLNYLTNNGVTGTYSVDSRNQLTWVGAITSETYDGNGNLTLEGSSIGGVAYTYDDENRLSEVVTNVNNNGTTQPVGDGGISPATGTSHPWKTDFVYDGLGRLRKRLEYVNDTLQTTTSYIYDGMRVIQERDSSNTPTVTYTRGADLSGTLSGVGGIGGLLARSSGYNWSSHSYYHADGNGNITCLINSSQSVVASYRYDPFGNTLSQSGSLADANVYRFSSKEIVSHTNSVLYYYGFRFYEPPFQRWLNRDPIGEKGGLNLYGCVGNNPMNYIDPLGFTWWDGIRDGLIGVGVGVVVGAVVVATLPASVAVGIAIGAAAVGGYMIGNNAYEFISGEEAYTGRPLTQDEWETRGGHAIVDAASLGIAKCKWFNRGGKNDWNWLNESAGKRWAIESDKITVSPNRWDNVNTIPVGQRGLTPFSIDPTQYPMTWRSGASPGLRFVWPFGVAGSEFPEQVQQ